MTWKEFKDEVERAGVSDWDEIKYIDTYGDSPLTINREIAEDGRHNYFTVS